MSIQPRLSHLRDGLQGIVGRSSTLRPFVCDGSPLDCEVFIVGGNPATDIGVDFWKFWSDDYGFHRTAWFETYIQSSKRGAVSPTRRRIDLIVGEAAPVRCLETNIFAKPTRRGGDLDKRERNTAPFDYLLRKVKPGLVIAHGKDARTHLASLRGAEFELWEEKHFSRVKLERARDIGRRIRERLR